MGIKITDYISITPDAHSAYTRGQILITYPQAERQEGAEDLAVVMQKYPEWSKSKAIRAAVSEMADRIRKGEKENDHSRRI